MGSVADRDRRGDPRRIEDRLLQRLAADAEEVLCVVDAAGLLTYVTPAAEKVFGWPADDLLGRPAAELYESGEFAALTSARHQPDRRRRTRLRVRHRDGTPRIVEARAQLLEAEPPEVGVSTVVFSRDVTAEARARRELRENDERLNEVFDNAPIGITEISLDGVILDANPTVCLLLGYDRDQLVGTQAADLIVPVDLGQRNVALRQLVEGKEQNVTYGIRFLRRDGEPREAEVIASVLRDDAGKPRSILALMQDVTDREELETQVSAQTDLIHHAHDAIFVKQLQDSTITFWNSGAERLYGYDAATAVGRVSHELLSTEFKTPLSEVEDRLQRTGEWSGELVQMTSAGEPVWVQSRWALIRDTEGRPLAALEVNRDVTHERHLAYERERLLEILEKQNRELRETDRLKSEFLLTISHELRTPLTAILGYADLLAMEPSLAERDEIDVIQRNGQRLLGLIEDILTLAQVQAGQLVLRSRQLDLAAVVRRVVDDHASYAREKGVSLQTIGTDDDAWVAGDETASSHVLRHLIANAIKFTPEGEVTVAVTQVDGEVRVDVEDTGIGVPQEARELVFEEFRQVDQSVTRRYGGVGIGLTVVSRLVSLQGGRLGLVDRPGGGSIFWFSLPATKA